MSDCFASGVELFPHDITHYKSYQVNDCLDFPLFAKDWTANEELALLDGIEKYGVGNWKVILDHMNGNKNAKQLEDHYWDLYMGRYGHLLPPKVFNTENLLVDTSEYIEEPTDIITIPNGFNINDEIIRKDLNKIKVNDSKDKSTNPIGYDLPGFMPLREDFDVEFENDAELLLADMEFPLDKDGIGTEHPSERDLKLQVINIYNMKLNERYKRKRLAIDYKVVDVSKHQNYEKKLSKEEKELVGRLKVLAKFQTPTENESLIEGVLRLKKIKQTIELLKLYRQLEAIVREAYRNGSLTPDGVQRIINMDENQSSLIYDFFVKEIKINNQPNIEVRSNLFILPRTGYNKNNNTLTSANQSNEDEQVNEAVESETVAQTTENNPIITSSIKPKKRGRQSNKDKDVN
eukprot:gene17699-23289_t